MPGIRTRVFFSTLLILGFATAARAVTLARAPEILEARPVGSSIRLLWALGGDDDGTLHENVVAQMVQRQVGAGAWDDLYPGGAQLMTFSEDVTVQSSWWDQRPTIKYRVYAKTDDQVKTFSAAATITPSLPMWAQEVQDGKLRLAWLHSQAPVGYPVHLGYVVQKKVGANWVDQTGYVQGVEHLISSPSLGSTTYRVRTVYQQASPGTQTNSRTSNEQAITIQAMCDGQTANPSLPPLDVIEIGDLDENTLYEGNDIKIALEQCQDKQYELLGDGKGDNDGVCNQLEWMDGGCIDGGCILRALPVTYENVAIMITNSAEWCDGAGDVSDPIHCLQLEFPAGLVIEGQGRESVFRGPVRPSGYDLPASVLEVFRRTFPMTLRNLVIDGRKHDQVAPDTGSFVSWPAHGFHVWSQTAQEIAGDGIGNDTVCEEETCIEETYENGRCEPDEECDEVVAAPGGDNDGECDTDFWPTTQGCVNEIYADDGCIHNVEVRNTLFHGIAIDDARRWIIEDSEIHDTGCVNRGYGFDCPYFDAPDAGGLSGLKMPAVGMSVGNYTSDFQIRRNQFYRTAKYGLSFKNGGGTHCNGLMEDHEASYNHLHHLGSIGIFGFGLVGARIHHNIIAGTTTFGDTTLNAVGDTFGMSLGGFCANDNEISNNWIVNVAGLAISWSGAPETKQCTESGCDDITPPVVGNTISHNLIDSTCLEKEAQPGVANPYKFGSIHVHNGAGGDLSLDSNTLTNSGCRFAISAYGQNPGIEPLNVYVSGGLYESGPNAATQLEDGFYCGAIHLHSANDSESETTIEIAEDTSIVNEETAIPKACVGYYGKLVIRDAYPATPFYEDEDEPEDFSGAYNAGGNATIIQCSDYDDYPVANEPPPPLECQ